MEYAPLLERLAQMDTFNAEKSAEIKRLDELYRKEKKIADEASFLYKQLKDEAAADAGGGAAQLRAAHAQFEVDKYSFRASFDEVANQVLADHRAEVERLCAVIAAHLGADQLAHWMTSNSRAVCGCATGRNGP